MTPSIDGGSSWAKFGNIQSLPVSPWVSDGMCVLHCPSKLIFWSPDPECDGIWRWSLWEVIKSRGWGPHDRIGALVERDKWELASSFSPLTIWGNQEEGLHWNLDFQPPELWEINICCSSHLVYDILATVLIRVPYISSNFQRNRRQEGVQNRNMIYWRNVSIRDDGAGTGGRVFVTIQVWQCGVGDGEATETRKEDPWSTPQLWDSLCWDNREYLN
jgi:hypothetical protein